MDHPNIFLPSDFGESVHYVSHSAVVKKDRVPRDRDKHAEKLLADLEAAFERNDAKQAYATRSVGGAYLEFSSAEGAHMAVQSLEDARQHVRLLNVRTDRDVEIATVFVPSGKEDFHKKKVRDYANREKDSKKGPRNSALLDNVDSVRLATVESFWTGLKEAIPGRVSKWVELWLRTSVRGAESAVDGFFDLLDELGIPHKNERLYFPERAVVFAKASYSDLSSLVDVYSGFAEMREAVTATTFFAYMDGAEQQEWVEDLRSRSVVSPGASVVCVLDSGVNGAHPLLEPVMQEDGSLVANDNWSLRDSIDHGTGVAGVAVYGDLKKALEEPGPVVVSHRLESVKILDKRKPTEPEFYGPLAQEAMARIQVVRSEDNRIYCSAVTADETEATNGLPTSWSAAVDEAIARPEEQGAELFLVAAGNNLENDIYEVGYSDVNCIHGVRSPGQAWNAITVGGYVDNAVLSEEEWVKTYHPLAPLGDISPYSTTSLTWQSKAPIKPEILCPAGGVVCDEAGVMSHPDLALLSASADFTSAPLRAFWGTSAAVAYAAWMASEIENVYPAMWPETVRALLIHSASWTSAMRERFCKPGSEEDTIRKGRRRLLRACGYGVPSLSRAVESASKRVNLIIEDSLQPFCMKQTKTGKTDATKDMRFYKLPWPKELLQELGDDTAATLRVTLSYYIEPSPGEVGWQDKYVYRSHGLKFDVNKPNETEEEFLRRISASMCDEGDHSGRRVSKGWYLGEENRDVGSIHSDFKETTALDLSDIEFIAVYPSNGWWRKRRRLGRIDSKARFSLVVSIETPEADVDLYSEIMNKIELRTAVPISV